MHEYFEILALLSQLQHTFCAKVVYVECFLEWVVEVDRCRAIYNNVDIVGDLLVILWRQSKSFHNEITLNRYNFWFGILPKFLLSHFFNYFRKAVRAEYLLLDACHRCCIPLFADHNIYLANIWAWSEYFFENNFSKESCAPSYKNILALIKLFDSERAFQFRVIVYACRARDPRQKVYRFSAENSCGSSELLV